jgi:prevent-host-death family protein
MKTYTITELKKNTATVLEQMSTDGYTLITQNGKPKTIMFDVEDSDLEQDIAEIRWLKARQSVEGMRSKAERLGLADLSLDDINAAIAGVRSEKR